MLVERSRPEKSCLFAQSAFYGVGFIDSSIYSLCENLINLRKNKKIIVKGKKPQKKQCILVLVIY